MNHRALRPLLIIGAVILIIGYGFVAVEVFRRMNAPAAVTRGDAGGFPAGGCAVPAGAEAANATNAVRRIPLDLVPTARIESVTAVGCQVVVLIRDDRPRAADGGDRLVIFDSLTGRMTATTAPAAGP